MKKLFLLVEPLLGKRQQVVMKYDLLMTSELAAPSRDSETLLSNCLMERIANYNFHQDCY